MHISLDSALGQQRRLNQVGESITQIAPDPAAAYSLRSLTGSDPKVVRVRRGSDNDERDFTASEVSSGALTSYVNAQVVAPLDIKALSATGRDGEYQIAKAAYSLRSLGTRQATIPNDAAPLNEDTVVPASGKYVCQVRRNVNGDLKSFTADEVTDGTLTSFVNESFTSSLPLDVAGSAAAAYGLRNLATGGTSVISSGDTGGATTGKFVVQVRRSSDDTIKSFTAAEVADGTLVSFVTESFQKTLSVTPLGEDSTWDVTVVDNSNYTIDCNIPTSNKFCNLFSGPINGGTKYRVEFDFTTNSGDASNLKLNRSSPFNLQDITEGFNSIEFDFTVDTLLLFRIGFGAANVFNATISNLTVTAIGNDGHVSTWYDQSGNGNNATQATVASQPKIVSAGSLVSGGLDFDGTDDVLETSVVPPNAATLISVANFDVIGSTQLIVGARDSTDQRSYLALQHTNVSALGNKTGTLTGGSISAGADFLLFGVHDVGVRLLSTNGTVVSNTSGAASNNTTQGYSIGGLNDAGTNDFFVNGKVAEVIIYASDQSDKRRAIEESIATANGITLGSFNRDGFVKTWYDQSVSDQSDAGSTPTGNHATQATADNQPKIVNAGALVTDGGLLFNGDTTFLNTGSSLSLGTEFFVTSVLNLNTEVDSSGSIIGNSAGGGGDRLFIDTSTDNLAIRNGNVNTISSLIVSKTQDNLSTYQASSSSFTFVLDGNTDAKSALSTGQSFRYIGGGTGFNLSANMKELIIYDTDQTDNRVAIEANIGETYNIDLPSGVDPGFDQVDGFVEAWYDQSGNGNDATQATAAEQPKIVSAGVLVTDSNNNPEIDFNGSNTFSFVNTTDSSPPYTVLSVSKARDTGTNVIYGLDTGTTAGYYRGSVPPQHAIYSGGGGYGSGFAINTDYLRFDLFNGSSSVIGVNGDTTNVALASDRTNTGFRIAFSGVNSLESIDGTIKEIILYQSDQSAKRTALETNIASEYGITLS